ncbi:MAG: NADH-quinone oxidoreductase subunit [Thermotogaceae bacterium]|jgi:NADH-quinone oxidoreductase subunit E|nr:NADH-quinone oxidoreductase subunit [Thermotogaceae bacterium]MDN5337798.1 NADH-quinone oxidoreductase subunit [Thermotogaceae bacterium]
MEKSICEQHEKLYAELDKFIEEIHADGSALIEVLHKAQQLFGHLPVEVQEYIAEKLNIPVSKVFGVVTFYSFFTMKPRGKHQIKVCLGTACYVKGADRLMDRFKEELGVEEDGVTKDGLFSLHGVRCLGACSMAPVVMIGENDFYGRVTPDEVPKIIRNYTK